MQEDFSVAGQNVAPVTDFMLVAVRTRGPYEDYASLPPMGHPYGIDNIIRDYVTLAEYWVLGTNSGFPSEVNFAAQWTYNILAAVQDGIGEFAAYRFSGNAEVEQEYEYAFRTWGGVACGGTNNNGLPCTKGKNLRNVMMADVPSNTSADGVFPFSLPSGFSNLQGPTGADLAGMFIGAVFYDIANEAGLGGYKADQIAWKTISLITNNTNFTIKDFGTTVQAATHDLWPDDRYLNDVADVLASRGIPVNGATDFHTNLPPAVGPSLAAFTFASSHPNSQPSVNSYGLSAWFHDGYTTNFGAGYTAIQFYKHSKYGPCDELDLTDGTFSSTGSTTPSSFYNNDGSYYVSLQDRNLGNLVLLVPGNTIRYQSWRERCPDEATGFYAEDVRPFGFIVTKATPNGFSFTVSALSSNVTFKTYQLSIVDPSTNTLGAATYNWTFTDYVGNNYPANGPVVQYPAYIDQPFTISIDRIRGGVTNNLTLRERGNDLDRNNGQAFVRNFVP